VVELGRLRGGQPQPRARRARWPFLTAHALCRRSAAESTL
jgi:hypothetical protein